MVPISIARIGAASGELERALSEVLPLRGGTESFMSKPVNWAGILGPALCVLAGACFGPEHPDPSRYEYRYLSGAFVAPYKAFPQGREREGWQCFDEKSHRAFDCTFVRGGFDRFQYIYRPRT